MVDYNRSSPGSTGRFGALPPMAHRSRFGCAAFQAVAQEFAGDAEPARGGGAVSQTEQSFEVPAVGRAVCDLELAAPPREGQYVLIARASCDGQRWSPTLSRRQVTITQPETR